MTKKEIEDEIQARIEFKFNELIDGIKNRLSYKYGQAFDMTQKSQYIWQAFKEVSEVINKEVIMAPPYDDMANRRKWESKEQAVDKIVSKLKLRGRDYHDNIKSIVDAVESAQKW